MEKGHTGKSSNMGSFLSYICLPFKIESAKYNICEGVTGFSLSENDGVSTQTILKEMDRLLSRHLP